MIALSLRSPSLIEMVSDFRGSIRLSFAWVEEHPLAREANNVRSTLAFNEQDPAVDKKTISYAGLCHLRIVIPKT